MIHTDSVAEVQDEGKRLANNRNLLEKFSIRSVRTGMNLILIQYNRHHLNPLRAYGDEPNPSSLNSSIFLSAPCVRG